MVDGCVFFSLILGKKSSGQRRVKQIVFLKFINIQWFFSKIVFVLFIRYKNLSLFRFSLEYKSAVAYVRSYGAKICWMFLQLQASTLTSI